MSMEHSHAQMLEQCIRSGQVPANDIAYYRGLQFMQGWSSPVRESGAELVYTYIDDCDDCSQRDATSRFQRLASGSVVFDKNAISGMIGGKEFLASVIADTPGSRTKVVLDWLLSRLGGLAVYVQYSKPNPKEN